MKILDCGGTPYIIENGLPYPTAVTRSSHARIPLDGIFSIPAFKTEIEIPSIFNRKGTRFADFEGEVTFVRTFTIENDSMPRKRLCFEGCFHTASVTLNGKHLGVSRDPLLPFFFEVTDVLRYGEPNLLEVTIDNRISLDTLPLKQFAAHKPAWKLHSGILRSVYIESLPDVYAFKTELVTQGKKLKAKVLFHGVMDEPVTIALQTADGETLASSSAVPTVYDTLSATEVVLDCPGVELWTPDTPRLYELVLNTPYETVVTRVGFRDIEVNNGQILLNGNPLRINGICRHEREEPHTEIETIKNLGANLARLAHYPHRDTTLYDCDRLGVLTWSEPANYQAGLGFVQGLFGKSAELRNSNRFPLLRLPRFIWDTRQFSRKSYKEAVALSLVKLIERGRNHPSILFWGVGNECFTFTRRSQKTLRELRTLVERFDKSRIAAYAAFSVPRVTPGWEKSFAVFDVVSANEYFGWYYGQIEQAREFWTAIAKKYPNKPLLLTETGADAFLSDPQSQERQCELLSRHYELRSTVPNFAGMCIWVLSDFECPEYGASHPVPHTNCKGLYTADGVPKPAAGVIKSLYRDSK